MGVIFGNKSEHLLKVLFKGYNISETYAFEKKKYEIGNSERVNENFVVGLLNLPSGCYKIRFDAETFKLP